MTGVLLNENIPARLARVLKEEQVTAIHVNDAGLEGRADSLVLAYALSHELAILTKDADCVDLVLGQETAKLILIRVGNMRLKPLIEHVRARASNIATFLESEERVLVL